MPKSRFIQRVNKFKIRYLSGHSFLYLLSAFVGLAVGLAAVIIKNLVHFIREALQNGFQGDYSRYYIFILPIVGVTLTVLFIKYINKITYQFTTNSIKAFWPVQCYQANFVLFFIYNITIIHISYSLIRFVNLFYIL